MKRNYYLLLAFFLLSIGTAFSQATTSKIQGIALDEAGQPLVNVNVTAKHTPTGTVSSTATSLTGRFSLSSLRIGGPYTVTFSYVGYRTIELTDIFLDLGKASELKISMASEGEQLKDVIVKTTSKSGIFNSNKTGAETNIGRRELTKLPSISRSASDFTRLEPSASGGSFGGRNDQFNNFTLNGSVFNNPFGLDAATAGGQSDAQPISLDAIDQIQVATAPYDVALAGFTGAAVNAVTKSGTNKLTGTVYGFYRNQDFTGNKIKGEKIFVPSLQQFQTGFSVGGALIKDKLFAFANFESDNRSDLGQTWFPNRGTGAINESRVLLADLVNVQNSLRSIGYDPGAFEGFKRETKSIKGIVKIDWNINKNNRLALIYNFLKASKENPAHPSALGFREANSQRLQFENSGYRINNNIQSFLAELNSNFSSKVTNKFQVGYTHFDDFRDALSAPFPSFRINDGNNATYITAGHEPFSVNNKLDQKVFQFSDNLEISAGNHNITFGFSFEKFSFGNSFNLGAYDYFNPGTGYIGTFFGDFANMAAFNTAISNGALSAAYANAQNVFRNNNANDKWTLAETNVGQAAVYLQDEFSVSKRFTLTYGIRFDKPLFFDTADKAQEFITNFGGAYDPTIPYYNPNTGAKTFFDSTKMPSASVIASPRLGFNWDANGDGTLQVRGGTGIFSGRFPFVWLGNQISNPNSFFYQVVDPNFKFPKVYRASLGIDKKLKNGLILTADLAYSKEMNGAAVQNWGLRNPSGTLVGSDTRPIYLNSDKGNSAYVFTNTRLGRTYNASFKAQKTFTSGLYTSIAYNYLDSKDVNSIEAEITGDAFAFNPVVGNANTASLANSKYGDKHRIIGVISKSWKYGKDQKWSTGAATFFEYAQGGRFNYTYAGDLNNDGSNLNDLLYIPTATQINTMNFSGTPAAQLVQKQAFEAFVQQDNYLSANRGNYAERYGALAPWRGKWDVKFTQDLRLKNSNIIQFSVDILNFGNLLNSDWGLVQQPDSVQPLGVNVTAGVPTYTFNPSLKKTFVYDTSLQSRWQMQFGLRYSF